MTYNPIIILTNDAIFFKITAVMYVSSPTHFHNRFIEKKRNSSDLDL